MDKMIVYLDDVAYARHQLAPLVGNGCDHPETTHWILVACPPHMTRHIGKWVNHKARLNWRVKWAEKLFAGIVPELEARGDIVSPVVAQGPLPEMSRALQSAHGAARVLDARRPKFGQELPPVTSEQPAIHESRWSIPGAVVGMGAVLVLASE